MSTLEVQQKFECLRTAFQSAAMEATRGFEPGEKVKLEFVSVSYFYNRGEFFECENYFSYKFSVSRAV